MFKLLKITLVFILIISSSVFACDSTLLALIAGEDINSTTVAKFLSISEKLQTEGDMLNAFDIAAAKKQHKEIMQHWLKIVVELGSASMVPNEYKKDFVSILSEIAKDLGKVRKKLDENSLVNIHEILESSMTKISILGAQINNKVLILNFLKIELMVYRPGLYLDDHEIFIKTSEFELANLEEAIDKQKVNYSNKASDLANLFIIESKKYLKTVLAVKNKEVIWDKLAISYNDLKNSFVKMKQQLLNDGFFS